MWDLKPIKEEKIGSNVFDIGHWIFFLDMPLRWGKQKQKYYWDFIKLKSFHKVKETTKPKRQHTKWEEIFVNNTSNKDLVSKIHKANINVSILNTNYPTADGQKTWMDFVSVKTSNGHQTHGKTLCVTHHQGNGNENHNKMSPDSHRNG